MNLRIPLFVVLRVHLIVMAVQSGGLFEIDNLTPPTPPVSWFSEVVSTPDTASDIRQEALFADISAAPHAQHAL